MQRTRRWFAWILAREFYRGDKVQNLVFKSLVSKGETYRKYTTKLLKAFDGPMSQPNLITKVRSRHPWEHALKKLPPENGRKNLFSHDSVSRVLFDLVQSVITWHRIYYTNVQGQRVKGQAQSVALRISNENVKSQERIGWSSGNCVKIIPQRIRRFLLYSEKKIKKQLKTSSDGQITAPLYITARYTTIGVAECHGDVWSLFGSSERAAVCAHM